MYEGWKLLKKTAMDIEYQNIFEQDIKVNIIYNRLMKTWQVFATKSDDIIKDIGNFSEFEKSKALSIANKYMKLNPQG